MYFVLSTGRAGSRTITSTLDAYEDTVCVHHPKPELAAEATAFFTGEMSREEIEETLRATRHPTVDGKIYGEVNLQMTLLFPILRDLYPEAKYVWLMRDGRDSVASMYYRGWYDETYPRQGLDWRRARLHGDRTGDFTHEEWAATSRFERCCWCWKKYNRMIEAHLATVPPDMGMYVRLDRLKATLPGLLKFLGIRDRKPARVERLNVARQPVSYFSRWSPRQRSAFESICGADMDRWFPEWRSPRGIWREVAAQPIDKPGRLEFLRRSTEKYYAPVARRIGAMRPASAR